MKLDTCYDTPSDHTPVVLTISSRLVHKTAPLTLCNKNTDWESFRDYVNENIDLKVALKTPDDIDNATQYITRLIQNACWIHTPEVSYTTGSVNYPLKIKQAVLEKRRLRRIWHQSRLREDKTEFNRASNNLKVLLQEWDNNTLQDRLETLSPSASSNYSLWKFTKNFTRPTVAVPPLRWNQGWARTPQQKVDLFADHLAEVFCPNEPGDDEAEGKINAVLEQDYQMSPPPRPVTVREVWATIKGLENKKSPGFDLITKEVLSQLPKKAVVFLTTLYNRILRMQYYPQLWKISQVLMIHKAGKPANEVTSYRPISLLPVMSKIFEKVLLCRIQPILEQNNTIPAHQFGFRPHHSTVEQVHRVCDRIRRSLEDKEYCSSAFLDIQQAFDRVWHRGLLYKIRIHLPHSYTELLRSYLAERLFQVKEHDATSKLQEIKAGVPQGSVLGPILYTLYTADLPEVDGVTTATYADDTAVLASNKDPLAATATLQRGLDQISKWLQTWRIRASGTKSVQVTFSLRKGNCPAVKLDGTTLPHRDGVRYLGLHLDRRLTWHQHVRAKREELNIRFKNIYCLLGRNSRLSTDNKLLIYKVILKPVWMYGIQLWGSASNTNISVIQRMQNSILRAIANVPWFVKNSEILDQLQMKTVKEEILATCTSYRRRLANHPNELAAGLTTRSYQKRLNRKDILPLTVE